MTGEAQPGAGDRPRDDAGGRSAERLVFFTDAVMAIAITLLVIDLRLPETISQAATDEQLRDALGGLFTSFLSVALSFMVIAVWWVGHDRLLRTLPRVDGRLVLLNFAFLGAVAFLPFPTTLIGRFVNLPTAVAIYALTNVAAGGSLLAMRWHADRSGYLDALPATERRRRLAIGAVAPAGFALSIPVALVDAELAALSWILFVPAGLALRWWFSRGQWRGTAGPDAPGPGPGR